MTNEEISRYGRQMIVQGLSPNHPIDQQLILKNSKIVLIGAGGLASPCLAYLAGAGVGTIGIIDDDVVENSNLHRQIIHSTSKRGMLKCESAKKFIRDLNPNVEVKTFPVRLTNENAFEILDQFDVILDCTDTPITRYLSSDAAVLLGKTLISASGVNTDGQLTILNFENIGPCYRCFHPKPPPPHAVSSCSGSGVIGACIGLVGVMQAVETLKVLQKIYNKDNFEPFMLQYSGFLDQSLRRFKMRGRRDDCISCGPKAENKITREMVENGEINYFEFCGSKNYDFLADDERITVEEFENLYWKNKESKKDTVYIDVRPAHHYSISNFNNKKFHNVPLAELKSLKSDWAELKNKVPEVDENSEVVVFCRHGNESRVATRILKDDFGIENTKDVIGGFFKYIDDIDPQLPKY